MTKAEQIRELFGQGVSTAEIARRLEIRYQHAYNVLRRSGLLLTGKVSISQNMQGQSPPALSKEELLAGGFIDSCLWKLDEQDRLCVPAELPKSPGVYAFCEGDTVKYVGLASMGLARRLRFYARPGKSQRTSLRLNALIVGATQAGRAIGIQYCLPEATAWNGLPVNTAAGLELGLIQAYSLPWNIRNSR
ncbi:hypothetical protein KBY28_07190 [Ruegeria pomeroyi]|uniref:hypothetical protein n=1 Tax=Ruegeria pomeroyi TaxID=89184 RepID=UPI001F39E5F9|nr:hypothetical protein [Ruegeria pomeroyi]MCE8508231.1 hypothetical protein [Ruegeria pomeroyi]